LRDTLEIEAQVLVASQLVVMISLHTEKFLWISQFRISYGGHSDLKWWLQKTQSYILKSEYKRKKWRLPL